MRVEFLRDWDWSPKANVVLAYLAGMRRRVTRRCAERAIAAGAARKIETRKEDQGDDESDHAERQPDHGAAGG